MRKKHETIQHKIGWGLGIIFALFIGVLFIMLLFKLALMMYGWLF